MLLELQGGWNTLSYQKRGDTIITKTKLIVATLNPKPADCCNLWGGPPMSLRFRVLRVLPLEAAQGRI